MFLVASNRASLFGQAIRTYASPRTCCSADNILYLCALDAEDPQKVREYMVQAGAQVDDLIKCVGLRSTKGVE